MLNPLEILRSGDDDYASYARHISKLQAFFRCINPSIHNWGFSLDSTEPLYLSLYSPTGLKVNSYKFILDLPAGFRLLDMEPGARRNRLSIAPRTVKSEPATLDGNPFTRYTLQYADSDIDEWRTADSILGIYKDGTGKAGDKGGIHYSRRINGNVTEITGTLPYHILPRINGGKTKHMVMSFYMGAMPQGMSREMTSAFIRDAVRAGVDIFSLYPGRSLLNDLVTANGGTPSWRKEPSSSTASRTAASCACSGNTRTSTLNISPGSAAEKKTGTLPRTHGSFSSARRWCFPDTKRNFRTR